jgi:putative glutathione S-transferase
MTALPTTQLPAETSANGAFVRQPYQFQGRFSRDGSTPFPAQAGRYRLYVSLACPWAHRAIIVRGLLGLEDTLPMSVVEPVRDERGWELPENDRPDGFRFLSEAYLKTDPDYDARYTVPCIWDTQTGQIVSNNYPDITIDLETQFGEFIRPGSPDLYPERLRPEIDALNAVIYQDVNNGVYRAGFAASQERYEEAVTQVFARLDTLEAQLSMRRYLVGGQLTEADIRLFTTLVRFDAVYVGHFKCNLRRLVDYPALWAYARDLYGRPAFRDSVNFDHIKRHYYLTHPKLDPSGIVPLGPVSDWDAPHGREKLQ